MIKKYSKVLTHKKEKSTRYNSYFRERERERAPFVLPQTQKGCLRDLLLHIYQKLTIKLEK